MGITTALTTVGSDPSPSLSSLYSMNKFLTLFALVASVTAEADPYLLGYGGYGGYGLGYAGHHLGYAGHHGLGYAAHHVAPLTTHHVAPVTTQHVAPVTTHHVAPVAAHYAAAGYASVSPSASLTTTGLAPAAVPAIGGLYAGAGRYVANSAGTVHVAKREAEADPYVLGYGGYGHHGLGYAGYGGYHGLGYAGLGHHGLGYAAHHVAPVVAAAHHVVHATHHVTGTAQVSPSASLNIAGLAPAAVPAVGGLYAAAGRYVANNAGIVHAA